ncbi:MAG: PilX N-terminal domain-containing pilus assembly protein [Motiliproteus sp.]
MINIQELRRQQGATLIIALIFMVLLTVISLSSMHSSSFEIKVARSVKSSVDALNASENALNEAEDDVCGMQNETTSCGAGPDLTQFNIASDGYYSSSEPGLASFSDFLGKDREMALSASGSYTVEYIKSVCMSGCSCAAGEDNAGCKRYVYRVTSSGDSDQGGSRLIQSYYFTIH